MKFLLTIPALSLLSSPSVFANQKLVMEIKTQTYFHNQVVDLAGSIQLDGDCRAIVQLNGQVFDNHISHEDCNFFKSRLKKLSLMPIIRMNKEFNSSENCMGYSPLIRPQDIIPIA